MVIYSRGRSFTGGGSLVRVGGGFADVLARFHEAAVAPAWTSINAQAKLASNAASRRLSKAVPRPCSSHYTRVSPGQIPCFPSTSKMSTLARRAVDIFRLDHIFLRT